MMNIHRFAFLLILAAASPALASPAAWEREGWTTDFAKITVDPSEIHSVIPRNQIPSIDAPAFAAVSEEADLVDREPVMSLVINGDARAYPLRIMMWHEIVNDEVGGVPVAVTYCPLCNASIVFASTVDDSPLSFGTTGKLRHSDLIMYDRQTESWWQQFSGEAIAGKYAGRSLEMLPSRLDSWGRFRAEHPDGKVLVPNSPEMRQYWRNPYQGYDTASRPFLFAGALPEGIPPMERVVLVRGESPFAIALSLLVELGEVREDDIIMRWTAGQASALDTAEISLGRDVGSVEVFQVIDGTTQPVLHDVTFAFVVNAFEPNLIIRSN